MKLCDNYSLQENRVSSILKITDMCKGNEKYSILLTYIRNRFSLILIEHTDAWLLVTILSFSDRQATVADFSTRYMLEVTKPIQVLKNNILLYAVSEFHTQI